MQGWRINMEDAHTHILSMPDDPSTPFFAVYDGHGGELFFAAITHNMFLMCFYQVKVEFYAYKKLRTKLMTNYILNNLNSFGPMIFP